MLLNCKKMESAGLNCRWNDTKRTLVISGTQPWSDKACNAMDVLADELQLSGQDKDQASDAVGDIAIWALVKTLAE